MPTFTVSSEGSERVVVLDRSRTSSGRSVSVRSPTTSSGSRSSDSWSEVEAYEAEEEDEIEPSDSASRSREPSSRRATTEARPAPKRRHSSRRITEREETAPRRHSSRRHRSSRSHRHESQRVPSDGSSSTVASHDDYPPYGHHGGAPMPPPPQQQYRQQPSGYRHVPAQSHGGYQPSVMTPGGYPDQFAAQQQALVHMQPQTDAFGYPSSNPFSPGGQPQNNPFSPMGSSSQTSYFATDPHAPPMPQQHHRPPGPARPQSFMAPGTHYGSELAAYQAPGMQPYPGYGMPGMPAPGMHPGMMGYGMPAMPGWYPPSHASPAPPPAAEKEKENDVAKLEALLAKHEEARMAWEKEWIAKREAEAAAKAAEAARAEEEKKRKQELADAAAKAKKDAEEKAKEAASKAKDEHDKKMKEAEKKKEEAEKEHEKKLKEAEAAKEDAVKKQKELEEAAEKSKPAPDTLKAPIKFKDAVGRKFSFPFHLCKTWKGMEGLIKQAFLHVDVIGEHVHQGHYDLTGPDGEIILPQVWDTMIKPDWEITMHMWPMPDPEDDKKAAEAAALADPFVNLGLGDLGLIDGGKKVKKSKSQKHKKGRDHDAVVIDVMPDHPPPGHLPAGFADPLGLAASVMPDDKGKKKGARSGTKSSKEIGGFASWLAGGAGGSRPSKKDDEKLGLARQRSAASSVTASSSQHQRRDEQSACAVM